MRSILPLALTVLLQAALFAPLFAQDESGNTKLTHRMTPEEEQLKHLIGRDFYPTDPPEGDVRMVAEFESMQAALVRYPFGIPMTLIAAISEDCNVLTIVANATQKQQVESEYLANGVDLSNCEWLYAPTDSYWTRDFGPWFVVNGDNEIGVCNFPYNRPRPNDNDVPIAVANYLGVELYGMPLIHTGGNWMCDGLGNGASTDLVWEENPGLSNDSIDALVETYLGVTSHHVLPDPLDEYIKHIDCWGKYLGVDKVMIGQVPQSDYRYSDFEYVANYFALRQSPWGTPYRVYRVFTPGNYPYTPYTNALILNKKVFVPITGSQHDDAALESWEEAMPGYEVVGIFHTTWENTDALHCRAKGIADVDMLYVTHTPYHGSEDFSLEWPLEADFIPYSGSGLKTDSLLVYYSIDGGAYQSRPFQFSQINTYSASFPFLLPGSEVNYYLHAADFSGRNKEHPFIGASDPHTFTVEYTDDITVHPDSLLFLEENTIYEGLPLEVYNFSDGDIEILEIEEGEDWWYIEGPVNTPYTLNMLDTLTFHVNINIIVDNITENIIVDTMDILTEHGLKQVIIKLDLDLIISVQELNSPNDLNCKVYPNPFSHQSVISFDLDEAKEISIDVLNAQGSIVQKVFAAGFEKGTHKVNWLAEDLPNGIYFVRILSEDQAIIRKVLLIR